MTAQPPPDAVRAATTATYVAFIGSGFAFASWASRIPQLQQRLGLDHSSLGLVLLAVAAGAVLALPASGPVIARFGSRRTVLAMALLLAAGTATVAGGFLVGLVPVVIGLFALGLANGAWDVAMNVQGAAVEQHLRRSIMSRFHAGFSLGTVAGALVGAAAVATGVSVPVHLGVVALVVAAVVPVGTRRFLREQDDGASGAGEPAGRFDALRAWREPRTLLVGLFVLAFAFAEGAGNDWIAVALINGYGAPPALGTLAFAVFLTAMTAGRWFGPPMLDRFGRVALVRLLAVLGIGGTLLFVLAPATPLAFVGVLLWGLGVSLGFPVGMSAASDDPRFSAGRVSVVSSIGYCAFLAGPPLIGFLGDRVTVLGALTVVAVLLGVSTLIAGVVTPPARADGAEGAEGARAPGERGGRPA